MTSADIAVVALRILLILLLYGFLATVLRVARDELRPAPPPAAPAPRPSPPKTGVALRRAPASAALRLRLLAPGETGWQVGRILDVPDGGTLGRGAGSTVVIPDSAVSTQHARVFLDGGRWVVQDLGSTNGTLVDGQPSSAAGLIVGPGQQLSLGHVRLEVLRA